MIFRRIRTTKQLHLEYLEIICAGVYSRAGCLRLGEQAYRDAALAEREAVLIDVRGISGRVPTILDRFEMGVRIAKHYRASEPRIRLAILGHEPMIHPDRFGELVARNRGADARAFTDEAEAREWIGGRPASP